MALRLSSGLPSGDGPPAEKNGPAASAAGPSGERSSLREKAGDLSSHLGELRARLLRSCIYLVVGMVVMWILSHALFLALFGPVQKAIKHLHLPPSPIPPGTPVVTNFTEPFFIKLQIAMVGGIVLAVPFIMFELWGFIDPALTPGERRAAQLVGPMSVGLFLLGVLCAYLIMPMAVEWFLGYLAEIPGAVLLQNPMTYVTFFTKMMLVFGLLFQLPVVLMFLGRIGILTSAIMTKYWRQCAVGLFTLAMIVAPSNDPGTMLALAVPLTILFFLSIGLVKMVEPKRA